MEYLNGSNQIRAMSQNKQINTTYKLERTLTPC